MTAGMNIGVKVWHFVSMTDDEVGGSQLTGTVVSSYRKARIQANKATQQFSEQGLETIKTYSMLIEDSSLPIWEHDQIQVIYPSTDRLAGEYFHVENAVTVFSARATRGYQLLTLTRSEQAHANQ